MGGLEGGTGNMLHIYCWQRDDLFKGKGEHVGSISTQVHVSNKSSASDQL